VTSRPRSRSRIRLLSALAALVIAGTGLLAATPAYAHDALVSTDPPADAALEALPAQLTLTFTAELLAGAGNEVIVTDAAGTALTDGDAVVDGTNLVQPLLADAASGAVTVAWRAVSSDGHPISGQYAFTVTAPAPSPTATDEPSATPEPTVTVTATAPTATPTGPSSVTTASPLPWIIGAIVVLLVVGAVIALLVARARRSDDVEGPGSDDTREG
jgi:copper resistance protein C